MDNKDISCLIKWPFLYKAAKNNIKAIEELGKIIKGIKKDVKSQVKLKKEFEQLLTILGIVDILGMTIMLEVGDIRRFPKVSF